MEDLKRTAVCTGLYEQRGEAAALTAELRAGEGGGWLWPERETTSGTGQGYSYLQRGGSPLREGTEQPCGGRRKKPQA